MRTLYVSQSRGSGIPSAVNTLEVPPLLSHLIQHIQTLGMLNPTIPEHEHLAAVLVDLIRDAPSVDMALPLPDDERAYRLAAYLRDHPSDRRDLATLAREFAGHR